jgi:hypothetical protein
MKLSRKHAPYVRLWVRRTRGRHCGPSPRRAAMAGLMCSAAASGWTASPQARRSERIPGLGLRPSPHITTSGRPT